MFKKRLILMLVALSMIAGGCVREQLTAECLELIRLRYTFTMNESGRDELATAIQDVRIFAYDAHTGMLVKELRATGEDIRRGFDMITLPDGDYFLVGWASSNPDLFQTGYRHVQRIPGTTPAVPPTPSLPPIIPDDQGHPTGPPPVVENPPPPSFVPATPGQTNIDDSVLVPNTNPGPGGVQTPANDQPGDVFNSDPEETIVREGRSPEEIEMDFMRNSAQIDVQIRNLQNLPATVNRPLNVFMIGRNGALRTDGTVDSLAPPVRYEAYSRDNTDTALQRQFQTLKIELSKETTQPMLLYIQDPVTGRDIVSPLNVQTLLRMVRGADGQLLYPNQEAIDRESQFRIALDIPAPGQQMVTRVNDFTIQPITPILE